MSLVPKYDRLLGAVRELDNLFPVSGITLTDSNGVQWILTIDTTGHLVTTLATNNAGTAMGLLLVITYPS